jgi:hypothetical protein
MKIVYTFPQISPQFNVIGELIKVFPCTSFKLIILRLEVTAPHKLLSGHDRNLEYNLEMFSRISEEP